MFYDESDIIEEIKKFIVKNYNEEDLGTDEYSDLIDEIEYICEQIRDQSDRVLMASEYSDGYSEGYDEGYQNRLEELLSKAEEKTLEYYDEYFEDGYQQALRDYRIKPNTDPNEGQLTLEF